MTFPLTPHFMVELAFWLVAGHVILTSIPWRTKTAFAFASASWILLATGHIQIALCELLIIDIVDRVDDRLVLFTEKQYNLFLLSLKILWLIAVIWFWPR